MAALLQEIITWIIPVFLAVVLHEVAHGWVAERLGDPTARLAGRITLNPLKHIDPAGTLLLPGVLIAVNSPLIIGAARPVPVDFSRLRPYRLGMALVALAGPGVNILLAVGMGLLLHLEAVITPEQAPWLFAILYRSLMLNCVLACFNLLPILPLDGGRVVAALLPERPRRAWMRLEKTSLFVLLALLLLPALMGYGAVQSLLLSPALWLLEAVLYVTGNTA